MNERIKALRKALGYTQAEFGGKVGLSRAEVANIESERAPVRPATIPVICNVLGVNRVWLETGEGEMFVSDGASILNRLTTEYNLSSAEEAVVAAFVQLPPQDRAAILRYVKALADEIYSRQSDEQEAEAVKQEYLRMKKAGEGSSASAGENGVEKMA